MRLWLSTFVGVLVALGLAAICLGAPLLAAIWIGPWAALLYVVTFPALIAFGVVLADRHLY